MHAEPPRRLPEKIIFIVSLLSPMMCPREVSRKRATAQTSFDKALEILTPEVIAGMTET
jgi:hypothetical protein